MKAEEEIQKETQKPSVIESKRLFRRKPLLVVAAPRNDGSWLVEEAGRVIEVSQQDFADLYELASVEAGKDVDAGLPDMSPGTEIEKDGRRLIRVTVIAGKGTAAYWHLGKPDGQSCQFQAVADMIDDPNAAHYVGKFVEPWEGAGPLGLKRTWVVLRKASK